MRRWVPALLALFLAASTASAQEQPAYSFDLRQYPGAPVSVTDFKSYTESGGAFKFQHIVCVTFRVRSAQALTSVTFAVSSRDANDVEAQKLTIAHDGTFAPGAQVVGHPRTERKNCVPMNVLRADAPVITVRLTHATYADGTAWTAPNTELPARHAPATPSPLTLYDGESRTVIAGLDAVRSVAFSP